MLGVTKPAIPERKIASLKSWSTFNWMILSKPMKLQDVNESCVLPVDVTVKL